MSRSFLTGLNLNKNELLNARIQNLSTPPSNPVAGQIYYDTDTNQITLWDGTTWVGLAGGGNVGDQIQAAIDDLTTDDIEEGSSNLYYTTGRAKDDAATLLTGATLTNITITGDGTGLTITAENGVADSDTDDLTEGSTNLYFTNQRALDATASAYDTTGTAQGIVDALDTDDIEEGATNLYFTNQRAIDAVGGTIESAIDLIDTDQIEEGSTNLYFTNQRALDATSSAYDVAGAAASAQSAAESYADGLASNYDPAGSAATALSSAQSYADGLVQGLNVKGSVRVASTANVANLTSVTAVDGVTLADGDRVLLKNQSTASQNGIYEFTLATTTLARAADQETVEKGDYALVTNGTYAATGWLVSAINLGGAVVWTQFSAANEYTAGDGIDITGNEISVALDSDSLSVSGSGLKVNLNVLGGLDNDGGVFINTGTGLTVNGSNQLTFASGYGVQKYAVNNTLLEPTSNVVSWTVTHNLGSRDVTVQVFENSTYTQVEVDVVRTNTTTVTLSWNSSANVSADTYRVVVVG